jgi:hypothetical protein
VPPLAAQAIHELRLRSLERTWSRLEGLRRVAEEAGLAAVVADARGIQALVSQARSSPEEVPAPVRSAEESIERLLMALERQVGLLQGPLASALATLDTSPGQALAGAVDERVRRIHEELMSPLARHLAELSRRPDAADQEGYLRGRLEERADAPVVRAALRMALSALERRPRPPRTWPPLPEGLEEIPRPVRQPLAALAYRARGLLASARTLGALVQHHEELGRALLGGRDVLLDGSSHLAEALKDSDPDLVRGLLQAMAAHEEPLGEERAQALRGLRDRLARSWRALEAGLAEARGQLELLSAGVAATPGAPAEDGAALAAVNGRWRRHRRSPRGRHPWRGP